MAEAAAATKATGTTASGPRIETAAHLSPKTQPLRIWTLPSGNAN
jgi:hypothetical protein